MFGKLKDKLKSWFKGSKEKIEETAEEKEIVEEAPKEVVKEPEKVIEKRPEKVKKKPEEKEEIKETELEKVDKLIEKAKKEPSEIVPVKFDIAKKEYEPNLENIQNEIKILKKETEEAKKEYKEIKKFKEKLEEAKEYPKETKVEEIEKLPEKKENIIKEKQKTFFSKLKSKIAYKMTRESFEEIFEDLEMLLLENNVALEVVEDIKLKLSEKLVGKEISKQNLEVEIKTELKNTLNEILIEPDNPLEAIKEKKSPFVILFFGINGTGKTTSIAKIAYFLKNAGFTVVLAAGDTFRAASIEQLTEHANKLNIPIIKHDYQSDPAAVGFDAIKYAEKHKIDVVLIDTAGRMHTKTNLLSEMGKICRVTKPDLKIFVAESIAGNDATEQAKAFHELLEIDGSILTKADIDEKGGTIISISHATNKPIFYLGTGQNYEDLELFNKQKFLDNLLE